MKSLQEQLDIKKWYESELAGRDLSGEMPWCPGCKYRENLTCTVPHSTRAQNKLCENAFYQSGERNENS